jgi:hypothetical protein
LPWLRHVAAQGEEQYDGGGNEQPGDIAAQDLDTTTTSTTATTTATSSATAAAPTAITTTTATTTI